MNNLHTHHHIILRVFVLSSVSLLILMRENCQLVYRFALVASRIYFNYSDGFYMYFKFSQALKSFCSSSHLENKHTRDMKWSCARMNDIFLDSDYLSEILSRFIAKNHDENCLIIDSARRAKSEKLIYIGGNRRLDLDLRREFCKFNNNVCAENIVVECRQCVNLFYKQENETRGALLSVFLHF